ncbi:hypothetical protein PC118_g23322 [Phytophthora cactorum]|uniref:Uncharacterized protein n=1 Tax=Phytophthora cactorum TaxID=29920 RepID=A0A8T1F0U5_9STRA|nr:hypothetical protein PC118_g23322 [Phytophthora cactorum]
MRRFMAERKEEFLVRGEYETFCAHRRALMEEAVEFAKSAITRRLVWRMELHCLKASFAAGRGEDMELDFFYSTDFDQNQCLFTCFGKNADLVGKWCT